LKVVSLTTHVWSKVPARTPRSCWPHLTRAAFPCLSRRLSAAGHPPKRIHTEGRVHFDRAGEGYVISQIDLRTEAEVPGINEEAFQEQAEAAKQNCPVSKALAGVEIGLKAKLVQHVR
jgi:hypothetical protein